ncbi:MAG: right-handed parallel beta-helix repeat-containing protein [Clostridia bacterium]|nr:right-handed parallel beta-helix repeat-containing protein [Clostridia bacterium]
MAIRKDIVWTVAADGVTFLPARPQDGGVQGEDNAVRVKFILGAEHPLVKGNYQLYIECEDATGGYDKTEVLTPDAEGAVEALVPLAWTQCGGSITLSVVGEAEAERVVLDGAQMTFRSRTGMIRRMQLLIQTYIQKLLNRAESAVGAAEKAAASSADSAGDASLARVAAQAAAQTAEANKADAGAAASAATQSSLAAANSATAAEKAAASAVISREGAQAAAKEAKQAATGTVRFTEQELAEEQKAQARKNIGACQPPLRFTVKKEDGAYTSSKTLQELSDAYAENRILICEFAGADLPLYAANDVFFTFASNAGGERIVVYIMDGDTTPALARIEVPSIQIGDQMWGGEDDEVNVDFTDTINGMIDDKVDDIASTSDNFGVINVRDPEYGAIGDGVTDDTKAIQDALYAAEAQGLPLYIPAGTYLVSKTITTHTRLTAEEKEDLTEDELESAKADRDDMQSKTLNIFGAGMGTKFITTEDFEGEYVFYIDVKNAQPRMLWVHDFAIDLVADVSGIYFHEIGMASLIESLWITHLYDKDPADTNVRAGIYCRMATVATFQRIKVMGNIKRIGSGLENIGIVCAATYSTKFIDCDIIFCKWGIYLSGGSNNLIEYCRIDENEYGVYQNTTAPTINYMPETRAYPADGTRFKGTARNLTIRNNRFEANNQQAIFLAAYSYGEMNYMYNAQVTIANNDFSTLGTGTAKHTSARTVFRKAIWLYQCKGVVIENNCFSGQPYDETVADTRLQNLVGERIEDITLRGNVAITKPIWHDEETHTIEKSNPVLSVEFVTATEFIPDIEADQCTRYSLGDLSLALDSILAMQEQTIALQESLIGGDAE